MAITYVGKGTYSSGSMSSVNASMPAGIAEGDILILIAESSGNTPATPSGWTSLASGTDNKGPSEYARVRIAYKIAGTNEGAIQVTGGQSGIRTIVFAFRGVDQESPIANLVTGTSSNMSTFTTTIDNTMVVRAIGFYDSDSNDTTNFSGWACASLENITEGHDQSDNDSAGGGIAFAYGLKLTAGDVGSFSVVPDATMAMFSAIFALAPAIPEQALTLSGIASSLAIGTPTMVKGNVNLALSGIPSGATVGTPTFKATYDMPLSGIPSGVSFGEMIFTGSGIPSWQNFAPAGIPSGVSFGVPILLRWDVLLLTPDDYFTKDNPARWDSVANSIEVETQPLLPGASEEIYRSNEAVSIGAGQTITQTLFYNSSPCINVSASLVDAPLDCSITAVTYYAWGCQVSVYSASAGSYKVVLTGEPLEVKNREKVTVQDSTSIAENGLVRYSFPANPLVQSRAQAVQIANALLASLKDPRRSVKLEWRGNPALELGDMVYVTDTNELNPYTVTKQELEYNGGLRAKLEGRR